MPLTTDPSDERLSHGVDKEEVDQSEAYLVLSDEERAKGFIRPVREVYVHKGLEGPKHNTRPLTPEEKDMYGDEHFVAFEEYPKDGESSAIGRFWTQRELDSKGCGHETRMGLEIAETYARSPGFYGSTYCVHCRKHLPVKEFRWLDGTVVGS